MIHTYRSLYRNAYLSLYHQTCVCLCERSLPADLTLVGAMGVLGGQAAAACALKSSHFSAQEGL